MLELFRKMKAVLKTLIRSFSKSKNTINNPKTPSSGVNSTKVTQEIHLDALLSNDLPDSPVPKYPVVNSQYEPITNVPSDINPQSGTQEVEVPPKKPQQNVQIQTREPDTNINQTPNNNDSSSSSKSIRTPYIKKTPDEEVSKYIGQKKAFGNENRSSAQKDLGDNSRPDNRRHPTRSSPAVTQNTENISAYSSPMNDSPFIELDLNIEKVFLVLPSQKTETEKLVLESNKKVTYDLKINGQERTISTILRIEGEYLIVPEVRFELSEPIRSFEVRYPSPLPSNQYSYIHENSSLYFFIEMANNKGKMHFLYTNEGTINPLPPKIAWILLNNNFVIEDLGPEDVEGEYWIWGYKSYRINLAERADFVINSTIDNYEFRYARKIDFCFENVGNVKDDYSREFPIITGNSLVIKAPHENKIGWNVFIKNKKHESPKNPIAYNWSGDNSLRLFLPDLFPDGFGKYQISFCQQNTRIPDDTLFFRWIPDFELEYPDKLIIPDMNNGHKSETIIIRIKKNVSSFKIINDQSLVHTRLDASYLMYELPPGLEAFQFDLIKIENPETSVNFKITIPRLKWRMSNQEVWKDLPQIVDRRSLSYANDTLLLLNTNDNNHLYHWQAQLESSSTNKILQESTAFKHDHSVYSLNLNEFYDTINSKSEELRLKVKITWPDPNVLPTCFTVLEIKPVSYLCKIDECIFEGNQLELKNHFIDTHINDFFQELSYSEILEITGNQFPKKIYKCKHDDYYTNSRDFDADIYQHLIIEHPNEEHSFSVVNDSDVIRRLVIKNLPKYFKCKYYNCNFINQNINIMINHLFDHYMDKFVNKISII